MKNHTNLIVSLLLILFTQSCAVSIKESSFILHDEKVSSLNKEQLLAIDQMKSGVSTSHLTITHQDNVNTHGLWIKQKDSTAIIIYFSGNSMRINETYQKILPELLTLNSDIVWLDHRGLGVSEGEATLENLLQDGLDTFEYVASKSDKKIILHGLSLGSFVAGNIAINKEASALILEASATNASDWVDEIMPWYAKMFTRISIDEKFNIAGNENVVQQYKKPLFILVGENDEVTPVILNQKLFDLSISQNKEFFIAKNARHGNALLNKDAKAALKSFIDKIE